MPYALRGCRGFTHLRSRALREAVLQPTVPWGRR
jgi:hypothetical protein